MPIAAVPAYLGKDFKEASPGLRFGMYLKLWGVNRRTQDLLWQTHDIDYEVRGQQQQEREVKYENKVPALTDARRLNDSDLRAMKALLARQTQAFDSSANAHAALRLDALAIAPFTTGLGNEHPLENGFAFLNPYGLPYLPGSGVKGVLRQAARELASGEWGEKHGWSVDKTIPLMQGEGECRKPVLDEKKQEVMLSMLDVLFGRESANGETDHLRGALSFWDVIPQIKGDSLMVEIMTPHQSHYYQGKAHAGSTTPHDSGSPNPISFLTVPPGSRFTFHVVCDTVHLARHAPELAEDGRWKTLLTRAFEHAFQWLGFGAKTAVGYGAMQRDQDAEDRAAKAREQREQEERQRLEMAERASRLAALSPNQRLIEAFKERAEQRFEQLRGGKEKPNTGIHSEAQKLVKAALEEESSDWTAEEKRALADAIEEWLPKLVEKYDLKDDWKNARKKLKLAALRGEA